MATAFLSLALANPGVIFSEGFEKPFVVLDFETVAPDFTWISDGQRVAPMGGRDMTVRPGSTYKVLAITGTLISDGVTQKTFLLSDAFGSSGPGDTPANQPYLCCLRPGDWVSWVAYEKRQGDGIGTKRAEWIDVGGMSKHRAYNFTASAYVNPATKAGTLDELRLYDFRRGAAVLYAIEPLPSGQKFVIDTLANGKIQNRGTIQDAGFTTGMRDEFSVTYMEQTQDGLSVPTTPVIQKGIGRGVRVEDGATTSLTRLDQAALRATTDQTYNWIFARMGDDAPGGFPSATYTIFDSPLARLSRVASSSTVDTLLRDSTGTYQVVGTSPTVAQFTIIGIMVSYDSATSTATLYVDGVASGSTVLSGGLYASAGSQAATWFNRPTNGTGEFIHFEFRHWSKELTSDEAARKCSYGIDPYSETSLTASVDFSVGLGDAASDATGNADVILTNFVDEDGAWEPSDTGEATDAWTRLPGVIGRPFMAVAQWTDVFFQRLTPGCEFSTGRGTRFVAFDNARLRAPISASGTTDFVATGNIVRVDPFFGSEPAIGQTLNFSAAGPNAGAHEVSEVLADPVSGLFPGTEGSFRVVDAVTDDPGRSGSWTGSGDYFEVPAGAGSSGLLPATGIDVTQVSRDPADSIGVGLATDGAADAAQRFGESLIERLGPQATPTLTNVGAVSLDKFGWQGDGEAPAVDHAPSIMKATPSTDYSPSVVFREADGDWVIKGFDRSPTVADLIIDDPRIKRASPLRLKGRFNSVRVRYGKSWTASEDAGRRPTSAAGENFAGAAAKRWRSVTSGTGLPELIVETFYLRREDAQQHADALLDIIQNGQPWEIELHPPRPFSELDIEPFDVVDVTYQKGGGGYLSVGRKGTIIAYTYRGDESARLVVLFF
jgi:hypothetical protein